MSSLEEGEDLPDLTLSNVHSSLYETDQDGPKTLEGLSKRTWYGKKRGLQLSEDGSGQTAPVPTVKQHKKNPVALAKKLLSFGSKLEPLGIVIGQSGTKYDGQAQAKDQRDDQAPVTASHVTQDVDARGATNSNLDVIQQNQDLCVQVIQARGLQAAESKGCSSPYCRMRLGSHKVQTNVVRNSLSPRWSETFVFPASNVEACLLGGTPKVICELWDRNALGADDFLGQADVDLTEISLQTEATEPMWVELYAEKQGQRVDGLGELQITVWLAPAGHLGRLDDDAAGGTRRTMLTTLATPPGVAKSLPLVVHTEGNTMYEEPCVYYLSLRITQVRDLGQFLANSSAAEHSATAPPQSSDSSTQQAESAGNDHTTTGSHPSSCMDDEGRERTRLDALGAQAQAWEEGIPDGRNSGDSGMEEDGDGQEGSEQEELEDDGQAAFDDDMQDLENPLQTPGSERNAAAPSSLPMHDKRLYLEVSLGNQRRRTKIARLRDRAFSWDESLVFAAAVPIADRPFKLLLCEVDRQDPEQRPRPLAIAFISLAKLMAATQESGQWFRLHDHNKRSGGKPISFAAVHLKLDGADADERRLLYGVPLLSEQDSQNDDSGNGAADRTVHSSADRAHQGQAESIGDPLETDEHSDSMASPSKSGRGGSEEQLGGLSSIAAYLGSKRAELKGSVISGERATGWSKLMWHGIGLLLFLMQIAWAVLLQLLRLQNSLWKRAQWQGQRLAWWLKLWQGRRRRESQKLRPPTPQPPSKPLGLVKLVLSSVELEELEELEDQPAGGYFCVFKCGPHWGQTSVIKDTMQPEWNWEVHIPLFDPCSLLLLDIFTEQHRKHKHMHKSKSLPPMNFGKLRIRLNTLEPGRQYKAHLPMLADRKQGGHRTATANLEVKVVYSEERPVVKKYFDAAQPRAVYALGLHEGDVGKQLGFEYRRVTSHWLESTEPPIQKLVTMGVLSSERQQFLFSRAKANWTRFSLEKEWFMGVVRLFQYGQSWESPATSLGLMAGLVTFSFQPQLVVTGLLLALMAYSLLTAPQRKEPPYEMRADPITDEGDDDEDADKGGITQLRQKYERLVSVALAVQIYLEEMANTLERLHGLVGWADPKATTIFLCFCLVVVLLMAALSLPVVLSAALCWAMRPPVLRKPTPPAPLNFFTRLPTRSDEII